MVEMAETYGYYRSPMSYSSNLNLNGKKNVFSPVRVLVLLIGVFVIPVTLIMVPLYLRYRVFADICFEVAESDVLEIKDGISPIFCEAHTVRMNTSFNAFQVEDSNIKIEQKKHFRLQKSMLLTDNSLEYWGFSLNAGSIVNLTFCSRYRGGHLMVVKDVKNFSTCGHSAKTKSAPILVSPSIGDNQIRRILYETRASPTPSDNSELYAEGNALSEESMKTYKKIKKRYDEYMQITEAKNNTKRSTRSINEKTPPLTHKEAFLHGRTNDSSESGNDSSFERQLMSCHAGKILLNDDLPTSSQCTDTFLLEQQTRNNVEVEHLVQQDNYYFYIFYTDNDDEVTNEVHVIFDVFKPTYEYNNHSRSCLNVTECSFPLSFTSSQEKLIVEVPMNGGINHDIDDVTILRSICQPRKFVYAVFIVAVLMLISLFALI